MVFSFSFATLARARTRWLHFKETLTKKLIAKTFTNQGAKATCLHSKQSVPHRSCKALDKCFYCDSWGWIAASTNGEALVVESCSYWKTWVCVTYKPIQ